MSLKTATNITICVRNNPPLNSVENISSHWMFPNGSLFPVKLVNASKPPDEQLCFMILIWLSFLEDYGNHTLTLKHPIRGSKSIIYKVLKFRIPFAPEYLIITSTSPNGMIKNFKQYLKLKLIISSIV